MILALAHDVPRLVRNEHLHVAQVGTFHHFTQPVESSWKVLVHRELVTVINAHPGIIVPKKHVIVSSEIRLPLIKEFVDSEAVRFEIIYVLAV